MTDHLINAAGISNCCPKLLRPLVTYLFNIPFRKGLASMSEYVIPLWTQRVEALQGRNHKDHTNDALNHVQMMVRFVTMHRPQELHDHALITKRIAGNNFGSMHQTTIQSINILLNILASDAEYNTIALLREELDRVFGPGDLDVGNWKKTQLAQLVRADSVIRETMRTNSFGNRAIFRQVLVDNLYTPQGHHLARGTNVSFISRGAHMNTATYGPSARKFDPFRFSRVREAASTAAANVAFVTTGPDFLPFGHGRHSCPGRFIADFELKMMMACVLRNYDLRLSGEYGGRRPENVWHAEALYPPENVKILVRRRGG